MPSRRSLGGVAAVILLCLVWIDLRVITSTPNTKDAAGYERLAVVLATTGALRDEDGPTREVEPVVPALMALQMRIDPRLAEVRSEGAVRSPRAIRALKQQNLAWAAVLLAGVAAQVSLLRRGRSDAAIAAAIAVIAVTLLLLENYDVVDRSLRELPAGAMVVSAGVAATLLVRMPASRARSFSLGSVLGLLSLTNAVFAYLAVPFALLLLWMLASGGESGEPPARRDLSRVFIAGLLAFAVVVGPWSARNLLAFGDPGIAEQGGKILSIRAEKNRMTPDEHRGAWVYWAPLPLQGPIAALLDVERDGFRLSGPLERIARYDDEVSEMGASFYRLASDRIDARRVDLVDSGLTDREAREQANSEAGERALLELRRQPGSYIRTAPVFLWRFMWPMNLSLTVPRPLLAVINVAGMGLLLGTAFVGLARRPLLFAAAGLPAGATAFYILLTHAIPRYARPLAPTMVILVVVAGSALVGRLRMRLERLDA